jgi:hypothetical protein
MTPHLEDMEQQKIEPGTVVKLRCGSPKMVVARFDDPPPKVPGVFDLNRHFPGWICLWTVQGALRSATFPPEALEILEPAADAPQPLPVAAKSRGRNGGAKPPGGTIR